MALVAYKNHNNIIQVIIKLQNILHKLKYCNDIILSYKNIKNASDFYFIS